MGNPASIVLPEAVGGTGDLTYTYSAGTPDPPLAGLTFTPATRTLAGTPTDTVGTSSTANVHRDRCEHQPRHLSSSTSTVVAGDPGPPPPGIGQIGEITGTKLTGAGITEKTIGGVERNHVAEGYRGVKLEVTAELTVAEVRALYGATNPTTADPLEVTVQIMSDSTITTPWASMIDDQQDVHFPAPPTTLGVIDAVLQITVPKKPAATADDTDDLTATGMLDVYILEDDFEAENEVFYIEVVSSDDINMSAGSSRDKKTAVTVIEDNETQMLEIEGADQIFESGSAQSYEVTADPPRADLPLEIRLDLVTLGGDTVRADRYTISDSSPTLNPAGDGTGNTVTVTIEVPSPDGDRMDEDYVLEASAVEYSLRSGVENTTPVAEHDIKVIDIHKLPPLAVSPAEGMVMEEDSVMLTLTIDRNPPDTIRQAGEGKEYTSEPVNVMLTANDMSSAGMGDYDMPAMVSFPEHDGKAPWTQSMMVEVMATMDEDIEMDGEVLYIDAEVDGTKNMEYGPNTMYDMYESVSMLTIEDATDRLVWANDPDANYPIIMAAIEEAAGEDMMFTVGDPAIEIMGQALFSHADMEGMTIEYAATSNMEDVAMASEADNMLMVMAMSTMGGDVEITVTATAVLPAGLKNLPQTEPNVAQLKFPVTVSPVVPALPLIAQLLLAALLGLGGYRRYLRR